MLRNEIQNKTGLTRKAIEYYEKRGLVKPLKDDNGYRNYTKDDLELLNKISLYRRLGLNLSQIEEVLKTDNLSSLLRKKQYQLDVEEKRKELIELLIQNKYEEVESKLSALEQEETIFQKLEKAFPGYFGQMLFYSYQPFLDEPVNNQEAFMEYIKYLDSLPVLELTRQEQEYIEKLSSYYDVDMIKEVHRSKIEAVNDYNNWLKENQETIKEYENYKNSIDYQTSIMKTIQNKLSKYMIDNKYYDKAIPLIRQFSKTYNDYYLKLLEANNAFQNK